MNKWRWKLRLDEHYVAKIAGISFENDYLRLEESGALTLKAGYSCDGCSPSIGVLRIFYIHPPEGEVLPEVMLPSTYRSWFLHDTLLQFKDELGITRKQTHPEFCRELQSTSFPLRHLYCAAVKLYGWVRS